MVFFAWNLNADTQTFPNYSQPLIISKLKVLGIFDFNDWKESNYINWLGSNSSYSSTQIDKHWMNGEVIDLSKANKVTEAEIKWKVRKDLNNQSVELT